MDPLEQRLTALVTQDAPPARDMAFTLKVMARIEQRRYRRALVANGLLAVAASALLFATAPFLEFLLQNSANSVVEIVLLIGAGMLAAQWSLQAMEN